jgi:RNA polymerase sigma-70 factor (ECF subfamily)
MLWLAQGFTHDRSEAEDIVQEALLKAFRYLPRFRGESQISTWLFVIVKNAGLEWLRNRKGREFVSFEQSWDPDDAPFAADVPDPARGPEQHCLHNEIREILWSEIDGLEPVSRNTIRMCALEENSYVEVAETLGISVLAIKSRIFRAKKRLRRRLSTRMGEPHESLRSVV